MDTFPDIGLQPSKFHHRPCNLLIIIIYLSPLTYICLVNYLSDRSNQKIIFDEVAKKRGLDPLHPKTWAIISRHEASQVKVCYVSFYYSYNVCLLI